MVGLAGSARWSWRVSMVFRTKRAKVLAVSAVAGVAAALTVGLSAPSGATPVASHRGGGDHVRLDRAFIIVLENHSAKGVIGDPQHAVHHVAGAAVRRGGELLRRDAPERAELHRHDQRVELVH